MLSIKTSAAVVAAALFSMTVRVASQAVYYIDPSSVPLSTRTSWCQTQTTSCPLLCLQLPGESSTTEANDFDCVCGNGQSPNASEFSQTLPYFICTEYGTQCVAACNGETACQSACLQDHPCGAQDPTRVNVTSTSSTMAATGTAGSAASGAVVYTGLGGVATAAATSTPSSKKSGAQAALDIGRSYGLGIVAAGVFAGFALII